MPIYAVAPAPRRERASLRQPRPRREGARDEQEPNQRGTASRRGFRIVFMAAILCRKIMAAMSQLSSRGLQSYLAGRTLII